MPLSPSVPPRLRGKRRSFHRPEVLNLRPVKSPNLYCACQAKRTPSDVGAGVILMAFRAKPNNQTVYWETNQHVNRLWKWPFIAILHWAPSWPVLGRNPYISSHLLRNRKSKRASRRWCFFSCFTADARPLHPVLQSVSGGRPGAASVRGACFLRPLGRPGCPSCRGQGLRVWAERLGTLVSKKMTLKFNCNRFYTLKCVYGSRGRTIAYVKPNKSRIKRFVAPNEAACNLMHFLLHCGPLSDISGSSLLDCRCRCSFFCGQKMISTTFKVSKFNFTLSFLVNKQNKMQISASLYFWVPHCHMWLSAIMWTICRTVWLKTSKRLRGKRLTQYPLDIIPLYY